MNIKEMHESFRVLGQQQGMQLVRGILPESIDVYLNNVINTIVREEILANAKTVLQDNVNTQPTALGPTNVLRTLYRNYSIDLHLQYEYDDDGTPINGVREDGTFDELCPDNEEILPHTYNKNKLKTINTITGYQEIWLPVRANTAKYTDDFPPEQTDKFLDIMMYLGFSVDWYTNYEGGNETPYAQLTKKESTGIRMIGGDVLETTFRDYCNAAGKDAPVGVILTDDVDSNGYAKEYLQLYTNNKTAGIYKLNLKYIAAPRKVKYSVTASECVNCDLPEYLHYEIVRRAVALFFATMGGNQNNSNNQQNNQ